MSISIGTLEKSAERLANWLREKGLHVEVEVFKTGRGGGAHYGQSYVELEIEADLPEGDLASTRVKFVAGGYATSSSRSFGGNDGWKTMSSKAVEAILQDLSRQGWAPAQAQGKISRKTNPKTLVRSNEALQALAFSRGGEIVTQGARRPGRTTQVGYGTVTTPTGEVDIFEHQLVALEKRGFVKKTRVETSRSLGESSRGRAAVAVTSWTILWQITPAGFAEVNRLTP